MLPRDPGKWAAPPSTAAALTPPKGSKRAASAAEAPESPGTPARGPCTSTTAAGGRGIAVGLEPLARAEPRLVMAQASGAWGGPANAGGCNLSVHSDCASGQSPWWLQRSSRRVWFAGSHVMDCFLPLNIATNGRPKQTNAQADQHTAWHDYLEQRQERLLAPRSPGLQVTAHHAPTANPSRPATGRW